MTTQTTDAVREAIRAEIAKQLDEPWRDRVILRFDQWKVVLAALDSRAGDAGEGDIETRARAIAQRVVPYEAHSPHVSDRQMDRRRVAKAAARLALSATPAPAVDAQSMSIAIAAVPARDALADLERFLTDHSGNEDTTEGMEADERAHNAMGFVRRVIRAAIDLCDGATDDCAAGSIVTVDGNDFDQLNAALDDAAPAVDASELKACSFADCPPGLFHWNGLLCFKSEYSTKAGQPDAYCVDSGEYFWGGASGDLEKRRNLMVQPFAPAAISHGEGR